MGMDSSLSNSTEGMADKTAVRFLVNIGNYALILSMTLLIAGYMTTDETLPTTMGDFLISSILVILFAIPVLSWGGIVVVALIGVDWAAWKFARAAHRLIVVIAAAALVGVPVAIFFRDPEFGLMHALGGAIYGWAFRSNFSRQEQNHDTTS